MQAPVLTRASLEPVLAPLDEARGFLPAMYTDPAVLSRELGAVFSSRRYAAGAACDLRAAGAWARVPLGDEALVLTRGADLVTRCLRDVCSHRAALLLDGEAGHLAQLSLECPYHRWRYDLAGRLTSAPGLRSSCDRAALGLVSHPVSSHFGQLFAHLRAAPPGERASPVPPWLARLEPAFLRRAHRSTWETRANWKLVIENFQESHHFPSIHPGLERHTAARDSSSVVNDAGPWLGGVMPLRDESETVSSTGRVGSRAFLAPEGDRRAVYDALVYPNLLTSLQPDYLLIYRLHPRTVDRTQVVFEVYVHAATPDGPSAIDDVLAFWTRTNAEDRAICERQQRGLCDSRAARAIFATSEDGVHAFDRLVARDLYEALDE